MVTEPGVLRAKGLTNARLPGGLMKRITLPLLLLSCLFLTIGFARSIADLLPSDTVFALGTQDLAEHQAQLQGFIDEFERLGVGEALQSVFASAENDLGSVGDEAEDAVPEALKGLGILDVLGQEAWLAVSMTASSPIPAVTLVARVDAKAQQAFAGVIAKSAGQEGVQALKEGGITFYQDTIDAGSASTPAAFAQDGDQLFFSSNVDVLRGVLRRHQGGAEASFTSQDGYAQTLGTLGTGAFYSYFDLAPVRDLARSFLSQQGFATVATRVANALETMGVSGGVIRITSAGIDSQQVQVLGDATLDPALYALLANAEPASTDPLSFAPSTALSVTSGNLDLGAWWSYLTGLVESAPELGISNVDQMLSSMTGIDLQATLFDWMGNHAGTVTTGASAPVDPGVPATNLLGEMVILVQAKDEAAATTGLSTLFSQATGLVGSMTDASGAATANPPAKRTVAGVEVTDYSMGPGIDISTAVTDGYALIATSPDAMDQVLTTKAASGSLPAALAAMRSKVPAKARSFAITDSKASVEASAGQIASQIRLAAGLGGSAGIDFDAVEAASGSVEAYLHYVASKLGGAVSYGQIDGNIITTNGSTAVTW